MSAGLMAFLFVGGAEPYAIVGGLAARKLTHHHVTEGHNDVFVPRQTTVMAEDKGQELRHVIREYAEHVVKGWPDFQAGHRKSMAGKDVNDMLRVFATLTPATKAREIVAAQFLQSLSQVVLDRNKH